MNTNPFPVGSSFLKKLTPFKVGIFQHVVFVWKTISISKTGFRKKMNKTFNFELGQINLCVPTSKKLSVSWISYLIKTNFWHFTRSRGFKLILWAIVLSAWQMKRRLRIFPSLHKICSSKSSTCFHLEITHRNESRKMGVLEKIAYWNPRATNFIRFVLWGVVMASSFFLYMSFGVCKIGGSILWGVRQSEMDLQYMMRWCIIEYQDEKRNKSIYGTRQNANNDER